MALLQHQCQHHHHHDAKIIYQQQFPEFPKSFQPNQRCKGWKFLCPDHQSRIDVVISFEYMTHSIHVWYIYQITWHPQIFQKCPPRHLKPSNRIHAYIIPTFLPYKISQMYTVNVPYMEGMGLRIQITLSNDVPGCPFSPPSWMIHKTTGDPYIPCMVC